MRTKSTGGFTLIELLIVIAIIGILAAVLIPNLLNARARAFDTAAQTCARSVATAFEVHATNSPFTYTGGAPTRTELGSSCTDVAVNVTVGDTPTVGATFTVLTRHAQGQTTYQITNGGGVVPNAATSVTDNL